ncbi:MAG TPA: FAD-dependent oxidoreductase [Caulobacteraceae bacterium]|jgi:glycine oxidase|nr:FAD-dependent oxidoreductase [Caulobacteraceae bacterium]
MKPLQGRKATIAGAGALGLVTALRLADGGARVTVCDPAAAGDNASGVAAGMLAPAFESALDLDGGDHFTLLARARDLWPALVRRVGLEQGLDRSGAALVALAGDEEALARAEARLLALGLFPTPLTGTEMRRLHPGLSDDVAAGLFTGEDWRIEPHPMLAALAEALARAGGRIVRARLEAADGGFTLQGRPVEDVVVIAGGAQSAGLVAAAPELARLSPVKGQILRFEAGPTAGPVVRSLHGYLAPQPGGLLAGATMEPGRSDRDVDDLVLARLRANAARLFPHLAHGPAVGRAGVRAATPDGAPLVGRSAACGVQEVVLCVGARRNGWLLAPLAAEVVARTLAGDAPGSEGAAFDPGRFG